MLGKMIREHSVEEQESPTVTSRFPHIPVAANSKITVRSPWHKHKSWQSHCCFLSKNSGPLLLYAAIQLSVNKIMRVIFHFAFSKVWLKPAFELYTSRIHPSLRLSVRHSCLCLQTWNKLSKVTISNLGHWLVWLTSIAFHETFLVNGSWSNQEAWYWVQTSNLIRGVQLKTNSRREKYRFNFCGFKCAFKFFVFFFPMNKIGK